MSKLAKIKTLLFLLFFTLSSFAGDGLTDFEKGIIRGFGLGPESYDLVTPFFIGDPMKDKGFLIGITNKQTGNSLMHWQTNPQIPDMVDLSNQELAVYEQPILGGSAKLAEGKTGYNYKEIKLNQDYRVIGEEVNLLKIHNRYYLFFHKHGVFYKIDYEDMDLSDLTKVANPEINEVYVTTNQKAIKGKRYIVQFITNGEENTLRNRVYHFEPGINKSAKVFYFDTDKKKNLLGGFSEKTGIGQVSDPMNMRIPVPEHLASEEALAAKAISSKQLVYQRTTVFADVSSRNREPVINEVYSLEFESSQKGRAQNKTLHAGIGPEDKAAQGLDQIWFTPVKYNAETLGETFKLADKIKEELNMVLTEREPEFDKIVDLMIEMFQNDLMNNDGILSRKLNRSVILTGLTGSGKTAIAEVIAKVVFDGAMIDIRMNGMGHDSDANRIFGASEGYKDHDKPTPFEIYKAKYGDAPGVILLDEIEKADPAIRDQLLELKDTGFATVKGKKMDFRNCIIIETSNKGADNNTYQSRKNYSRVEINNLRKKVTEADVRRYLKQTSNKGSENSKNAIAPEYIARTDLALMIPPLSVEGAQESIEKELRKTIAEYKDSFNVILSIDNNLSQILTKYNYKSADGLRVVKSLADRIIKLSVQKAFFELGVEEGSSLKVKYTKNNGIEAIEVVEMDSGKKLEFDVPKADLGIEDPMLNPEYAKKLLTLEGELNKRVMGQEKVTKKIADAMIARAMNHDMQNAMSIFLLGPTGTGKTELGKGLALSRYGDADKRVNINVGQLTTEDDAVRLIYGDKRNPEYMSEFHDALLAHKEEGAVINFDEFDNAGYKQNGQNQARNGISKKFFDVLDERFLTLPNGEKIDLRKFTLLFTSNDLEDAFKDSPSDDLRMAAYDNLKKSDVRKYLLEAGYDEAFIARTYFEVMQPTVQSTREAIFRKFLAELEKSFRVNHGVKAINFSDEFVKIGADIFFSHEEGARALRKLTQDKLSAEIGVALLNLKEKGDIKNSTISLEVSDNYYGLWYNKNEDYLKRDVQIGLKFELKNKESLEKVTNVTELAKERILSGLDEATLTAAHELGHGLLNIDGVTGQKLRIISIKSDGMYLGYAGYDPTHSKFAYTRRDGVVKVAKLLAGRAAEAMLIREIYNIDKKDMPSLDAFSTGASNDLEQAKKTIGKLLFESGLTDKYFDLPMDKEFKTKSDSELATKLISEFADESWQLAEDMVYENRELILRNIPVLIEQGEFTGEVLKDFYSKVKYIGIMQPQKKCNGHFAAVLDKIKKLDATK